MLEYRKVDKLTVTEININDNEFSLDTSGVRHYLVLDPEDDTISAGYIIGSGVPGSVWHHRAKMFGIPTRAVSSVVREILETNKDLLEEIVTAYRGSDWNGSNWVGSWDDSADGAEQKLTDLLDAAPVPWDASDWLWNACTLNEVLEFIKDCDDDIDRWAAAEQDDALLNGHYVDADDLVEEVRYNIQEIIEDEVADLRDEAKDARDEAQVMLCNKAISGDFAALRECLNAIEDGTSV